MPARSWVTAQQRHAAKLLLDGWTGYRALLEAGYSRWTARKVGFLLRRSWGLRQAILEEQQARNERLRPTPKRKKKYTPRGVGLAVESTVFPENSASFSNLPIRRLYDSAQRAERISQGLPPKEPPQQREYMADQTNCPTCGYRVSRKLLFLNYAGNGYRCSRCG